ncbi:MAG: hypothetical protein LE169_03480 [Endomicrobium sp.]|nr:hypothetical protein [Endomicrobium sp.]
MTKFLRGKYDWIEVTAEKRPEDFRKESFKPIGTCRVVGHIGTKDGWAERKALILNKVKVYKNISELISDSKPPNFVSLAVFKPTEILDFKWCKEKDSNRSVGESKQLDMFASNNFKRVEKLPFKFKYIFKDESGRSSKLTIMDWETGALFLRYKKDFKLACEKVKEKYLNDFARGKDLYFFLGTTKKRHNTAKTPFSIIGTFHPPKKKQ